eukprot:13219384-Alexandrium_andersonii.AAC.1
MSASLVGSEMCIRDSSPPVDLFSSPELSGALWLPRGGSCGGAAALGTVSYTHLTLPTICSV